jgi:hypothetical protein
MVITAAILVEAENVDGIGYHQSNIRRLRDTLLLVLTFV